MTNNVLVFRIIYRRSFHGEISFHDSLESAFELLVRCRVTERVDGAVEIAEEVREHKDMNVNARRTKTADDGEDMIRSPTSHKCP